MNDFDFYHQLIDRYDQEKYGLLKAQTFDEQHFGFPDIYYKIMETDQTRVGAFKRTFEHYNHLKGAVVCEAGVGKLALTKLYLPFVKKAYLIENNPEIREFIIQEINELGFANKVVLLFEDARAVSLPEEVDFVIAEMMSIFCANEFQVQVFKHLRQFLKPGGKLIPEKILNLAQLAATDFEPDIPHYPINFTRHLPTLLSLPFLVNGIDLYTISEDGLSIQLEVEPILNGKSNALFLQSYVQLATGINFTGTDSLMPPTVIKMKNDLELIAGQKFNLKVQYDFGSTLDHADFNLI